MMRLILKLTGMLVKRLLTSKPIKNFWFNCGIVKINLTKLKVSFKTDECFQRGLFFFFLFISFLLTINLKLIIVHVEIKIVNKEAATKRSTLLHAQRQLCMVAVPLNKAM